MKRIIAFFVAIVLIAVTCGCTATQSGGVPQEEYDELKRQYDSLKAEYDALQAQLGDDNANIPSGDTSEPSKSPSEDKPQGKFDEDAVISQLEVKELSYSDSFWNYTFLLVTNNSEYDISLSVNVNFYDENGTLIGAKSDSEAAVESGYTVLLYFMPDEKYATIDYEFSVDEEDFYDCVLSDLSYEGTVAKEKVILSVTNNGDEPANFVEANVLFFNGDKLVGFSNHYFIDDDSELKPGKSINKEMECYEDFDSYQVYFSGRR